ncbi:hypothetical protein AX14_008449 [Amanita brunnescens Koide BX004]|nr:hypothetical protein AX14_008449 [Amanita brunnescens Koide BX004]
MNCFMPLRISPWTTMKIEARDRISSISDNKAVPFTALHLNVIRSVIGVLLYLTPALVMISCQRQTQFPGNVPFLNYLMRSIPVHHGRKFLLMTMKYITFGLNGCHTDCTYGSAVQPAA